MPEPGTVIRACSAIPSGVTLTQRTGVCNEVAAGEHVFVLDKPVEDGGTGKGPNPPSYLMGAIAGCFSMNIERRALARNIPVRSLVTKVHGVVHSDREGVRSLRHVHIVCTIESSAPASIFEEFAAEGVRTGSILNSLSEKPDWKVVVLPVPEEV